MKRKHFIVLISALTIIGIVITTLFATGVLHLKVFNDISSSEDTSNVIEIQDDLKNEGNQQRIEQQKIEQQDSVPNEISDGNGDSSGNKELSEVSGNNRKPENRVEVLNNSPEYEIEMYSYLDISNNLCMEIDYYFDGVSHSELFKQVDFPEFDRIFKIDGDDLNNEASTGHDNNQSIRLSNVFLNTKYGKVYFTAERDLQAGENAFLLYVLSLKDKTIKFLYQGTGYAFNTYLLSPEKDYIAFNYFKDEKGNNSSIHIFSSKDDVPLVIDNMTTDGRLIGSDLSSEDLLKEGKTVSYYLIRWRTLEDLKLREYSYVFDKNQNLIKDEQSYEVSYNVLENRMIYPEEKYAFENTGFEKDQEPETHADKNVEKDAEKSEDTDIDEASDPNYDPKSDAQQGAESGKRGGADDVVENAEAEDVKQDIEGSKEAEDGTEKDKSSEGENNTDSSLSPDAPKKEYTSDEGGKEAPQKSGESETDSKGNGKDNSKNATESVQVAVLKSFYMYVAEGNFEKAYDLLDDNFESTSQMFMGMKISKKEITPEIIQELAEAAPQIFKGIKIEKILKEEQAGDDSYKIYYTQSVTLDPSMEPLVYPLIVTLKKMAGTWRIVTVIDGIPGVDPFK
ncbi:MAG TPA: hypothetical protein GXX37_09820 [Clostridiaceae bacterium]|nr:hypothetical protein [Clostridiaceae bacterium]